MDPFISSWVLRHNFRLVVFSSPNKSTLLIWWPILTCLTASLVIHLCRPALHFPNSLVILHKMQSNIAKWLDPCSTLLLPNLISHSRSINYLNLCISPLKSIGQQLKGCCVILRLLLVSVCFSPSIPLLICNASLTVIGVVALMIVDQQMVMQSIWAKILFHGLRRNIQPLPSLPPRVNIVTLLTLLLKLCGFDHFSLNLASLPQIQLHCGVIMWELFIYVRILSFMPEQNILNLTIISFENKSNNATFRFILFLQMTRLLIFLPNHLVIIYLLSTETSFSSILLCLQHGGC